MTDVRHSMGHDLTLSSTGDLATSSDDDAVRERVLRRLLTASGAYIWQLSYGGGLATFVGATVGLARLQAIIRSQLLLEASVARQPVPSVSVSNSDTGIVVATITYAGAVSGSTQQLSAVIGS